VPDPTTIQQPKQLLLEGADPCAFFASLIRRLALPLIQLQNFGGIDQLRPFLKALAISPHFSERVGVVAVIRDAEADPRAAYQSVTDAISHAGLTPPPRPGEISRGTSPLTAVYVLPDPFSPGMLETLCVSALTGEPDFHCVDEFLACVALGSPNPPTNQHKARLYSYLASRQRPGLRIGPAAEANYLALDAPQFQPLIAFLRSL